MKSVPGSTLAGASAETSSDAESEIVPKGVLDWQPKSTVVVAGAAAAVGAT